MRLVASFLISLLISSAGLAVEPDEMLADPALETRAREVSQHIRCVQCQNETIDESNAQIARDMRVLIRQRILAGDTNEEIIDYMVSRYGDYVLLKPRFQTNTLILWFGPFIVFVFGAWMVVRRMRAAKQDAAPAPLSDEERARLESTLHPGDTLK